MLRAIFSQESRESALERLNREIRRKTNVVGSFPDSKAALVLVAARLRYALSQLTHIMGKLQQSRFSRCYCLNSTFAKGS